MAPISRRYFVMNAFDGAMTMLGVIMGSGLAGSVHPKFVIGAGIGASFAMGVSGLAGAYLTERAERIGRFASLSRAMLSDLHNSIHAKASLAAAMWAAIIDGVSPALAAIVPMVPYVLAMSGIIRVQTALLLSLTSIFALLFSLGVFLARISKENLVLSGLRMLAVGIGTAFIVWIIGLGGG